MLKVREYLAGVDAAVCVLVMLRETAAKLKVLRPALAEAREEAA